MKINLGFVDVLVLIFIVLKLTGYINWSWLVVLSPIWLLVLLVLILALIKELIEGKE